tara:strand:+ start:6167 stop:7114 length:948 start_codon:yes stop_codon:yes gene_type:complete
VKGARRLSAEQIRQAAIWMARLWSDNATEQDRRACAQWREADPAHEYAWQQLQQLQTRFDGVPADSASRILARRTDLSRRQVLALAGLVCGGAGLAAMGSRDQWQPLTADERTATGEIRQLQLADGTRLFLNTATSLDIYPGASGQELHLLQGELLVDSSSNSRPLLLRCRDGAIRPISARFSLRQYDQDTELAVFRGSARVEPLRATGVGTSLSAGEASRFSRHLIQAPQRADLNRQAWTEGKLVAERLPLTRFIAELDRYRAGILRIDPALASLQITGVFSLHDTDATLARLPQALPVRVRYFSRYWVSIEAV